MRFSGETRDFDASRWTAMLPWESMDRAYVHAP